VLVTSPGLASDAAAFDVVIKVAVARSSADTGSTVVPLSLNGSDTVTVRLSGGAGNQVEARFDFSAAALGNTSLDFTATLADGGDGAIDALRAEVPVLPQQAPVFVGTSFAVRPPGSGAGGGGSETTARWQEGLELPEAVPGSGSLDLVAGVGNLPIILASLRAVRDRYQLVRCGGV
jgi:hypothetical protein